MIKKFWLIPFLSLVVIFINYFITETLWATNQVNLTEYHYPYGNLIYKNGATFDIKRNSISVNFLAKKDGLNGIKLGFSPFRKIDQEKLLFQLKNEKLGVNYQNSYQTDLFNANQYLNLDFRSIPDSKGKLFNASAKSLDCLGDSCNLLTRINFPLLVSYVYTDGSHFKEATHFLFNRLSSQIKLANLFIFMTLFLTCINLLTLLFEKKSTIKLNYKAYLALLTISFSFLTFLVTSQNINSFLLSIYIILLLSITLQGFTLRLFSLFAFFTFLLGLFFFLNLNKLIGNALSFWAFLALIPPILIKPYKKVGKTGG